MTEKTQDHARSRKRGKYGGCRLYMLSFAWMLIIPSGYLLFNHLVNSTVPRLPAYLSIAAFALMSGLVTFLLVRRMQRYREGVEQERDMVFADLGHSRYEVQVLSGLLPICAHCKKIRNNHGYWQQLESYIMQHSEAEFSHSLCESCRLELYPELYTPDIDSEVS